MSRFETKFLMEELHRNKWQPLMLEGDKPIQRHVLITPAQAEIYNKHATTRKIRYVEAKAKSSGGDGELTSLQKAAKLVKEIKVMPTVELVDAALDGQTAKSVIKAGAKRKEELNN